MDASLPNASEDTNSGADSSEICASLSSLKVGGVAPAVGDSVSVEVSGTISRIDGENAYLTPEKVNGEDVMKDEPEAEPTEDSLSAMAQQADAGGY